MEERIATKAGELFLRYGIRSVSMDEIASHLGISKKTIYQFYSDKDSLVQRVVVAILSENVRECLNTREASKNPVHEMFIALDMIQDILKVTNPVVMYDLQKYHPVTYRKLTDHQHKFWLKLITDNLEEGKRLQLYRQDIDVDIIARFRLTTIFMIFNPEFTEGMGWNSLTKTMEELTIHFLYGITSAKGQKLIQKYQHR